MTSYINSARTSISIYSQHTPCQQTFMPLTVFLSCRMQEAGVCCVFRKKRRRWLHASLWKEDVEESRQRRLMERRTSYAPHKEHHRALLNFTRSLFRTSSQHALVYYYYCYYPIMPKCAVQNPSAHMATAVQTDGESWSVWWEICLLASTVSPCGGTSAPAEVQRVHSQLHI